MSSIEDRLVKANTKIQERISFLCDVNGGCGTPLARYMSYNRLEIVGLITLLNEVDVLGVACANKIGDLLELNHFRYGCGLIYSMTEEFPLVKEVYGELQSVREELIARWALDALNDNYNKGVK